MSTSRRAAAGFAITASLALSACGAQQTSVPPTPSGTSSPSDDAQGFVQPSGGVRELATGLESPWSIVRLSTGETLVSERDTAQIESVADDGTLTALGTVADVVPGGEGGLLGLAELVDADDRWLYAYFTSGSDNRIVRMPLSDDLQLGAAEPVLSGLAKAGNHDGGRIAFGPDGMLYATVGDAGVPDRAQDLASPNGKILRMTPTGAAPDDNPFDGSLVYSLGHRNPQGIAWDDDGQLFAAEFGQNTWDEFNRIEPGANYGWPIVEGIPADGEADDRFADPLAQWSTDAASPSGLAFVDGTFFMAALRGERVWAIYPSDLGTGWDVTTSASGVAWFPSEFGRIRDVTAGSDGTLWFLTNNTDGRGDPRPGDDRLLEVALTPLVEG